MIYSSIIHGDSLRPTTGFMLNALVRASIRLKTSDYTEDYCMYQFTSGQSARMEALSAQYRGL